MYKCFTLGFILLCASLQALAEQPVLRFYTEIAAPYYWLDEDGIAKGASVDLAKALINETGVNATIEHLPWARAFYEAVNQDNVVLLSVLKTPEREQQLQWLGLYHVVRASLFSLSDKVNISITSLDQARKLSVGSIRGYGSADYLLEKGFKEQANLVLMSNSEQLWNLLYKERIDLVLSNHTTKKYEISNIGFDPEKVISALEIPDLNLELQIATGNKTPLSIVENLRAALKTLKENGEYQQIMQRWSLD